MKMVSLVSSPSLPTNVRHVRSISLPSRSHPCNLQVEEELAQLKSWEASSCSTANVETACGSIVRLKRLYTSVNDLISLPQTQQALLHRKDDKLVDELLDLSMSLLDLCGSIKDVMEQVSEQTRNIESALRRRKEGLKSDSSSLWKMKDAKRAILALKKMNNKIEGIALLDLDHHLSSLIRSLRDTCALSISIFGSLISSMSIFGSKPKSTNWTIVSNLIRKPKKASVDQPHISNEALESHTEVIEESLECMSRTFIKARVSLLNIRSQ
ncbi:hypothetical protein HanXRQr2_Chr15g0700951 [Helianthus annuus]|uniref:DUF241 domain protein n=1 Tax=Helianthus annuus TaxID=4232 RepID=A0A251UIX4_HELAN|nr:uncharacterized protein LOC110865672 [Helianthus annuus]KAF5765198.1 hypothetical protein HanXRQr2_Chr15g0700951 [Helianthus annuus]KAJ0473648.1 hypothetical protein HanHA89_Chr15g0620741 [Helianthus annuus]